MPGYESWAPRLVQAKAPTRDAYRAASTKESPSARRVTRAPEGVTGPGGVDDLHPRRRHPGQGDVMAKYQRPFPAQGHHNRGDADTHQCPGNALVGCAGGHVALR